jgi:phage anti-repressor protein
MQQQQNTQQLNIIDFIEKNPLNSLNNDYNNKLLDKIKVNFTDEEQKIFLANFYCHLNYSNSDFFIDVDNIWKWLGYNRVNDCVKNIKNSFTENKDYIIKPVKAAGSKDKAGLEDNNEEVKAAGSKDKAGLEDNNDDKNVILKISSSRNLGGSGLNKQKIFINKDTFKNLTMETRASKGKIIRRYYIKLEEILNETIKEQCIEMTKQLTIKDKQLIDETTKMEREKHNKYLHLFHEKHIIYVLKVFEYPCGDYIIKIGYTGNIRSRMMEHNNSFGNPLIIDCFECVENYKFEQFILHHQDITIFKELQGHENKKELILINKLFPYSKFLKIIQDHIDEYNQLSTMVYQKEKLNIILKEYDIITEKLIEKQIRLNKETEIYINQLKQIKELGGIILEEPKNEIQTPNKIRNPPEPLGPKVQQITVNDDNSFSIFRVFNCLADCDKQNFTPSSVKRAYENKTLYNGYRWNLVDRNLDINTIYNIGETKVISTQNTGYVAKLDINKTEILDLYENQLIATKENGYGSRKTISDAIKNFTVTKNHYYQLYKNVDKKLREDYEQKHGKPLFEVVGFEKICAKRNERIAFYSTRNELVKQEHISNATLKRCIETGENYYGFYYREICDKI